MGFNYGSGVGGPGGFGQRIRDGPVGFGGRAGDPGGEVNAGVGG